MSILIAYATAKCNSHTVPICGLVIQKTGCNWLLVAILSEIVRSSPSPVVPFRGQKTGQTGL